MRSCCAKPKATEQYTSLFTAPSPRHPSTYSLDVDLMPADDAVGAVTANIRLTNFFEPQNLITAGGAELHPDFSVIIDPGDGGVFVNAITADNSTVQAEDMVNDVLAQVFFDASVDACGDFVIQLGPASALADGDAFPVPFGFTCWCDVSTNADGPIRCELLLTHALATCRGQILGPPHETT